jgi:hypothetical protein
MIKELKHLDPATLALARLGALIYRDGVRVTSEVSDALFVADYTDGLDAMAGELIDTSLLPNEEGATILHSLARSTDD